MNLRLKRLPPQVDMLQFRGSLGQGGATAARSMVRALLGGLVTMVSLSACGASQVEIPASVDARARECYELILSENMAQLPEMKAPVALEDGTLLVQWRISEANYGSCQVDSIGSVLMLTQVELPDASLAEPADSNDSPDESPSEGSSSNESS